MPTPKQVKLAEALIQNQLSEQPKTAKEIMENIGYATNTAKTPNMIIGTAGVQNAIAEIGDDLLKAAERKGLNPEKIVSKINELLDATKLITKNNVSTGEIEVIAEQKDYQAIDKGLTHALKIGIGGGYKVNDQGQPLGNTINLNFFNQPEVKKAVENFEADLKQILSKPEENNETSLGE